MYKLLLCWRYLRTRYIALASIISVTLGVATMIVVNSVMAGFTHEMQGRIHGILSDVVFDSHTLGGFPDAEAHMARIREIAGQYIAGMTPTVVVPAMLVFDVNGQAVTRQVSFIGVDEKTHGQVSDFNRYLQHPANRKALTFELRDGGYDTVDHEGGPDAKPRERMAIAGWQYRRIRAQFNRDMHLKEFSGPMADAEHPSAGAAGDPPSPGAQTHLGKATDEPPPEYIEHEGFVYHREEKLAAAEPAVSDDASKGDARAEPAMNPFQRLPATDTGTAGAGAAETDPTPPANTGVVLGIALACYRAHDGSDRFFVLPGDDVKIMAPTAGMPPKAASDTFTIVDFYESKMSEYDSNFVFVPIRKLQEMRGMIDPATGVANVTSIQIKLKNDADGPLVRDLLQQAFPAEIYGVQTWRDKQGPLLAAVQMETAILNVLLFMIIAVAGFGILAIFFMIVVEKTRDIGILKSLGASSSGILGIFLAYGLSLGIVGSGAGMIIGLVFVANINAIADALAVVTGHDVFDPSIYYFQEIPTIVEPWTIGWIVVGAMAIAVVASILPARRAARLHPVEALRYE